MKRRISIQALLAIGALLSASTALAQSNTTGAVQGSITDQGSGESVVGATVVATSPALQGTQAELTDASGAYYLGNLPPGIYQITVYFVEGQTTRGNVLVQLGKTAKINVAI